MKRGQSGLSCLLAVDKPVGKSSHDIVNIARRAIGERRVGHAGTLDPFASGVLALMVGPAARLDKYLTGHDKEYVATIVFGTSTTTDDCTGEPTSTAMPSSDLLDRDYAESVLDTFAGESMQMPPVYSAIKVNGKRAYDESRRGNIVKLKPRAIEVLKAKLLEIGTIDENAVAAILDGATASIRNGLPNEELFDRYLLLPFWKVAFKVSKGTYIRSLARDIGMKAGCPAHLAELARTASGNIGIGDCVAIETLEKDWKRACIDPVYALGFKVVFANDAQVEDVSCGRRFRSFSDQLLCIAYGRSACECLPPFVQCSDALQNGELVSIIVNNELKAIYKYDKESGLLSPDCVFNIGVSRGYIG